MPHSLALVLAGTLLAASLVAGLEWRSRTHVVTIGFWFADEVTFTVHDPVRLGGGLSAAEAQRVEAVARGEIAQAFAEFRVRVTDRRDAFYRVAVRPALTINRRYAVAGQSHVFGPLGGSGAVGFVTLAAQAMAHAPPGASRPEIVDAIGRGIGRAAVHEFVHQILPRAPVHATRDRASYEYWASDRAEQYYGPMRWDAAHLLLVERLGRR